MVSNDELLSCSFCSKNQDEVKKLIAGPGVYICNECVDLCVDILHEEMEKVSTNDPEVNCRPKRTQTVFGSIRDWSSEAKVLSLLSIITTNA